MCYNIFFKIKLKELNSILISLMMELELFNTRLKYEDDVLWRMVKGVGWREVKQTPNKRGYSSLNLNYKMYLYHRVVYNVCNPDWDITDNSKANEIDHICGVRPLDNRIENLRKLNHQQNNFNNLHWVKGYSYDKRNNKYKGQIQINGKNKYLGDYDTEEEARAAYLEAKAIHHII